MWIASVMTLVACAVVSKLFVARSHRQSGPMRAWEVLVRQCRPRYHHVVSPIRLGCACEREPGPADHPACEVKSLNSATIVPPSIGMPDSSREGDTPIELTTVSLVGSVSEVDRECGLSSRF